MPKCIKVLSLFIVLIFVFFSPLNSQYLDELTQKIKGTRMRVSSGNLVNNEDALPIEGGKTETLAVLKGPGKITHIWMTIGAFWVYPLIYLRFFSGNKLKPVSGTQNEKLLGAAIFFFCHLNS